MEPKIKEQFDFLRAASEKEVIANKEPITITQKYHHAIELALSAADDSKAVCIAEGLLSLDPYNALLFEAVKRAATTASGSSLLSANSWAILANSELPTKK